MATFVGKGKYAIVHNNRLVNLDYYYLYKYYPLNRYPNLPINEDQERKTVWGFKDGELTSLIEIHLESAIRKTDIPLVNSCAMIIPASTMEKTKKRFEAFCENISYELVIDNGYEGITTLDHPPTKGHAGGNKIAHFQFFPNYFSGKDVLLFDDVITSGTSFRQTAQSLLKLGAVSVTGIFLAKTSYKDENE